MTTEEYLGIIVYLALNAEADSKRYNEPSGGRINRSIVTKSNTTDAELMERTEVLEYLYVEC